MRKIKLYLSGFLILAMLSGCQQPSQSEQDEKRKEQADVDAEAQAKADQQKLNEQSMKLERDLQRRYRFYAAVSYEYTGQIKINGTEYGISHKSQPSIPLYTGDRIRTVEEVQSDLNILGLNTSFRFWNIKKPEAATGCQFSGAKAFYENGSYRLQSSDCGNIFMVFAGEHLIPTKEFPTVSEDVINTGAQNLAQAILSSQKSSVDFLVVQMQSTLNGTTQNFQLQRKK